MGSCCAQEASRRDVCLSVDSSKSGMAISGVIFYTAACECTRSTEGVDSLPATHMGPQAGLPHHTLAASLLENYAA